MEFRTRKFVKHSDLNPRGSLFGGRLMEWLDEEAAIYAICQLGTKNIVTKVISVIDFKKPAFLNDIVEIGVDVVKFGKTSITVKVVARVKDTKDEILSIDSMVFVAVDEHGRPVAHGKTEKRLL